MRVSVPRARGLAGLASETYASVPQGFGAGGGAGLREEQVRVGVGSEEPGRSAVPSGGGGDLLGSRSGAIRCGGTENGCAWGRCRLEGGGSIA